MAEAYKLDPTILREYDIRGIVGDTLKETDAYAVGRSFGTIVARKGGKKVVVGYDGRTSSPILASALIEGLNACGLDVVRIGVGPTPMVYYASVVLDADAGIAITGSHNPPEYNGIKIVIDNKPFFGADITSLGTIAASGDFAEGSGGLTDQDVMEDYINRLVRDFVPGKELNIAWDAGNGSAGEAMVRLTKKLPGKHTLLFEDIDGTFPNHHPDPTVEKNLADLKVAVKENGCDLGIGFDGDGDRIGVVDAQGRVLWGDQILLVLASDVLKDVPGAKIIADVKASQVFFDEVNRLGGEAIMGCTGHSLVKKLMAETGAPLGGEMSGHIFFKHKWYGFDCALYAAVRLLSILAHSDETLADIRDKMPKLINTPELRFDCDEDRKFTVIDEVKERLAKVSGIDVFDIDGVRVKSDDGWWLLRASNTQAVLVARCEASTDAGLERLKTQLVDQLVASGVEPPAFD